MHHIIACFLQNALNLIVIIYYYAVSIQCNHGDVRLVNGTLPNEGRVEVCITSIWGTVCDETGWGKEDAEVICRQLGYTPNGK